MDNYQVCALRHKRHIIASNVELDDDTITELTKQKLINKAMLDNLKVHGGWTGVLLYGHS